MSSWNSGCPNQAVVTLAYYILTYTYDSYFTFMRWLMVLLTSSMDGLWLGSLSQQWVMRVSMGSGRSLISGGRVPASKETSSQSMTQDVFIWHTHSSWLTKIIVLFWSIMDRHLVSWFWLVFLTSVDGPHDTKCWTTNLIEGFLACDDLPQDDAPAEDITLLTVVTTYGHTAAWDWNCCLVNISWYTIIVNLVGSSTSCINDIYPAWSLSEMH